MKKGMSNFSKVIACLVFLAASCKKNDVMPSPAPSPAKKNILAKVERDSFCNSSLHYNGIGQLTNIIQTSYGMSRSSEIMYDAAGKPVELKTADYRVLFYYAGLKLVRTATINIHVDPDNTVPEQYAAVSWSGDNITEIRAYFFRADTEVNVRKSTYDYYADGDLRQFGSWNFIPEQNRFVREFAESYTYDDKKSPWPGGGLGYRWLYNPYNELCDFIPSAHNVLTQTSYWESDEAYAVRTFNYTYNADGYPLKTISVWDFMDPRDSTITDTIHYSYLPVN